MDFVELYTFEAAKEKSSRKLHLQTERFTRTLQDVAFADKAGGFGFSLSSSTKKGSRFIIWRSHCDTLELSEFSANEGTHLSLIVSFSGSGIIDCTFSDYSNFVDCLVCTSDGSARLTFAKEYDIQSSLLSNDPVFCCFCQHKGIQSSLIKAAASGVCSSTGDAIFTYGLSSGIILVTRIPFMSKEPVEMFELHQSSMIQKLWSGITPFTKSDGDTQSSVLDITLLRSAQFFVSVHNNHRLRLWDMKQRCCVTTMDLLDLVPKVTNTTVPDTNVLRAQLAPGLFHRVKSHPMAPSDDTVSSVLVYVSLVVLDSVSSSVSCLPSRSVNYWCWLTVDCSKAKQCDRNCMRVVSAKPTFEPSKFQNDSGELSILDFLPAKISSDLAWRVDEGCESRLRKKDLPQSDDESIGVWWLTNQMADDQSSVDYRYLLGWSSAANAHVNSPLAKHCLSLPPGSEFANGIPNWRCLPAFLENELNDVLILDTVVEEFLDYIFEPNRFSWYSISNALKSLLNSHQLVMSRSIVPAENMFELRLQLHQVLTDNAFLDLPPCDFLTDLRTFYMTAVDYHDHGLEPMAIFEIPYGTGLLVQPDSSPLVPYAPGLVVVRRWGFSVIRPLDSCERLLWGRQNPLEQLDPIHLTSPVGHSIEQSNDAMLSEHINRARLLLINLRKHELWNKWQSALYGSEMIALDPGRLAVDILDELNEHCYSVDSVIYADHTDWQRAAFSESTLDSAYLLGLDRLTGMLEGSLCTHAQFEDADSDASEFTPSVNSESFKSLSLSTTLFCEAFLQTCDTRLKFAFSVLILSTSYHLNSASVESVPIGEDFVSSADVVARLIKVVQSLRVLRWLASTRLRPTSELKSSNIVIEHLSLLGISESFHKEVQQASLSMSTPTGPTLLQQLCSTYTPLCPQSNPSTLWTIRCLSILKLLYNTLNPSRGFGRGLLRVFRMLLSHGQASHLIKLAQFLCPTPPSPSKMDTAEQFEMSSNLNLDRIHETQWWDGDHSFVFLCAGLAQSWLGHHTQAKNEFLRASEWLNHLAHSLTTTRREIAFPLVSTCERFALSDLLLPSIFPDEFGEHRLLCGPVGADGGHELCPEEVQVRFIMKILPLLEATDSITQILELSEIALNVLAKVCLTAESDKSPHQAPRRSRRLTSILANLHSLQDLTNEGFLCDPVPCQDEEQSPSPLYKHLAQLEAALWTRMFKHHLFLGNYETAHVLIRSNPDVARRKDCLRQLIVTLCDRRDAAQLVSFDYGPSEDEFLLILESRARATDVIPATIPFSPEAQQFESVNPYYDVLYAFHVRRANYRAAAMVLFEHAHRLAEESACSLSALQGSGFKAGGARLLYGLQRQAACLVASINALYLVPREHQWLVRPGISGAIQLVPDEQTNGLGVPKNKLELLLTDEWAFAISDNADDAEMDVADADSVNDLNEETPPNEFTQRCAQTKQILKLDDLIRMYTLTRSRLRIAQVCWEQGMLGKSLTNAEETLHCLLSLALYDDAVKLIEQYRLDPVPIVDVISSRCAELAQHPPVKAPNAGGDSNAWFTNVPCLPGLTNVPSPISQEFDSVVYALHNLTGPILHRQRISSDHGDQNVPGAALSEVRSLSLLDLYWLLLEKVLAKLDSSSPRSRNQLSLSPGHLRLLACQRVLASGPTRLHIPEWLSAPIRSSSTCTGHPASLLRLYMQYDRVESAYKLAMDMLDAAQGLHADPNTFGLKTTLDKYKSGYLTQRSVQSLWLPHGLIVRLLEALQILAPEYPACSTMSNNLSKNVTRYMTQLNTACAQLQV